MSSRFDDVTYGGVGGWPRRRWRRRRSRSSRSRAPATRCRLRASACRSAARCRCSRSGQRRMPPSVARLRRSVAHARRVVTQARSGGGDAGRGRARRADAARPAAPAAGRSHAHPQAVRERQRGRSAAVCRWRRCTDAPVRRWQLFVRTCGPGHGPRAISTGAHGWGPARNCSSTCRTPWAWSRRTRKWAWTPTCRFRDLVSELLAVDKWGVLVSSY